MKNGTPKFRLVVALVAGAVIVAGGGLWVWTAETSGIAQMPRSVLDRWARFRQAAVDECDVTWSPTAGPSAGARARRLRVAATGMIGIATRYRTTYLAEDYPYWLSVANELETENGDFACVPSIRAHVREAAKRLEARNRADRVPVVRSSS